MQALPPPTPTGHSQGDALQVPSPLRPPEEPQVAKAVDTTYTIIGWVLQGGVMLSAAVIVIGLLLEAMRPDKFAPQKLQFFPQTFEQFEASSSLQKNKAGVH